MTVWELVKTRDVNQRWGSDVIIITEPGVWLCEEVADLFPLFQFYCIRVKTKGKLSIFVSFFGFVSAFHSLCLTCVFLLLNTLSFRYCTQSTAAFRNASWTNIHLFCAATHQDQVKGNNIQLKWFSPLVADCGVFVFSPQRRTHDLPHDVDMSRHSKQAEIWEPLWWGRWRLVLGRWQQNNKWS